jgi:glycosyltransferase 2 family protein
MLIIGLVVGLPLSAFFLYLATRDLDLRLVGNALGRAEPVEVAAAVIAIAALYLLQAERWRVLSGPGPRPMRRAFLALVIGSVAVNNLVPGRPGDLMRGYWLGRLAPIPFTRALATVIVDRAADVVILTAVIAGALPFVEHPRWLTRLVLAALVLALLATGALILARSRALWRPSADPDADRDASRRRLALLVRGVGAVAAPGRLGRAAALTLLSWLFFALACWWVAHSLGIALSAPETLVVTAVVNLGVAIPSSPGFVGTYQWLGVASLGLFGVPRADAFAFALVMQAVWWVPTTLTGIALAARAVLSRLPGRVSIATPERDAA